MNSGLTSHQQRGHTETGPRFKVSSERPEKRGIDLATPGLVVQRVIHYTTTAPDQILTVTFGIGILILCLTYLLIILYLSVKFHHICFSSYEQHDFRHNLTSDLIVTLILGTGT